jgi:hypothetical protein
MATGGACANERKGAGYGNGKLGSCDGESSGRPQRWEGSSASKGKGAGAQPSCAVGVSLGLGKKATRGRKKNRSGTQLGSGRRVNFGSTQQKQGASCFSICTRKRSRVEKSCCGVGPL